jgi:hypothetical protein
VVREALAQYLGEADPSAVKGVIADLQERVENLEKFSDISGIAFSAIEISIERLKSNCSFRSL